MDVVRVFAALEVHVQQDMHFDMTPVGESYTPED